jgi:hypothetical protein
VGRRRRWRSHPGVDRPSVAVTSSSRSTWWPWPAWACWRPPASSWPRTPSAHCRQRPGHRRDVRRVRGRDRGDPRWARHGGQHHQGRHQGLRHRSAVIAAVALFASFREIIAEELFNGDFAAAVINIADPKIFVGAAASAGRRLLVLVAVDPGGQPHRRGGRQEVRRQFRRSPDHEGHRAPDYGPVIDICTSAALRELATPALLAVLLPRSIVGFGLGAEALGASWPLRSSSVR